MTQDWFADERFWTESYPAMFPEASFGAARDEVEQIVALTGCGAGRMLDLACGPARHAVPFAARGFRVTGVDRSPFLLDKARAHAGAEGVSLELVEQDMREPLGHDVFDLAICMFTSFGFFEDESDNLRVLANVYDSLRSGGAFVLDVGGKEIIARKYQAAGVSEMPDSSLLIQRRSVFDDWSRMSVDWLIVRGDALRARFTLRHFIYSGRELRTMLESVGFDRVDLYGDVGGAPYGPDARRLVAVARKGRVTSPA